MNVGTLQSRINELIDLNHQLYLESELLKEALKECLKEFKLRASGVSPIVMRENTEMMRVCTAVLKKVEGRQG